MLQALKKPFWISGPTSNLDLRQALKGKPLLQGFSIFLQSVVIVFFRSQYGFFVISVQKDRPIQRVGWQVGGLAGPILSPDQCG
jgi:hypothetical protein